MTSLPDILLGNCPLKTVEHLSRNFVNLISTNCFVEQKDRAF